MADLETKQIGGILEITLNRPERMNALSADMREGLRNALEAVKADYDSSPMGEHSTRAIILTGAGKGFCAGADLDVETMLKRRAGIEQDLKNGMNQVVTLMQNLPVPIIGAINGAAAGAGLGLAFACDIILASPKAKFHLAFARIGAALDGGTSYFLTRALGPYRAKALALQGGMFTAKEAHQWGMIEALHEPDELLVEAHRKAAKLANGPSHALNVIKQQLGNAPGQSLAQCLEAEAKAQASAFSSNDFEIGIRAFAQGEPAIFQGVQSGVKSK